MIGSTDSSSESTGALAERATRSAAADGGAMEGTRAEGGGKKPDLEQRGGKDSRRRGNGWGGWWWRWRQWLEWRWAMASSNNRRFGQFAARGREEDGWLNWGRLAATSAG